MINSISHSDAKPLELKGAAAEFIAALEAAAACEPLSRYYHVPADLAAFHSRLSFRFLKAGRSDDA